MLTRTKRRPASEVNAGSMADIAFLLLIFFLVTTTIQSDQGLLVLLPPYDTAPPEKLPERNVLSIHLNTEGALLVEGERMEVAELTSFTQAFLSAKGAEANQAVVSLHHDAGTDYAAYFAVYHELQRAYHRLWESEAQARFGFAYDGLTKVQQRTVRNVYPMVISEAEPTTYGE